MCLNFCQSHCICVLGFRGLFKTGTQQCLEGAAPFVVLTLKNRQLVISPEKKDLFEISKELQCEVYNHGKPRASPWAPKGGETLSERERGSWEGCCKHRVQGVVAFHWLSWDSVSLAELLAGQEEEVFLLPVGLCYQLRAGKFSLFPFDLSLMRFLFINFHRIIGL